VGYNAYSTFGRKPSTPTPVVPIKPAIDPEHLAPTATPEFVNMAPIWQGFAMPEVPQEYESGEHPSPVGGGGPVDMTPDSPEFGVGGGPGLTTIESQQVRTGLMSLDYGAVAARTTEPLTDRHDGSGPHADFYTDESAAFDSPQTLQLKRTGVGQPNDPYARTASRFWRWWDRTIDFHRYDVVYRPMVARTAYTAQAQPAVPDGTQYDSPYATAATVYSGPQDRFVVQEVRRIPTPFDQNAAIDPTQAVDSSVYGLQVWGL
jgi:hypothetical protein